MNEVFEAERCGLDAPTHANIVGRPPEGYRIISALWTVPDQGRAALYPSEQSAMSDIAKLLLQGLRDRTFCVDSERLYFDPDRLADLMAERIVEEILREGAKNG